MQFDIAFQLTFWGLQGFWVLGALAAAWIGMLTVEQMYNRRIYLGMPYFYHMGMWNDVFTVHPLLAYAVARYWQIWREHPLRLAVVVVIAFGISLWANLQWAKDSKPLTQEEIAAGSTRVPMQQSQNINGKMTVVGWIHVPHMTAIVAVVLLMLASLAYGEMLWRFALGAALILVAHLLQGDHWLWRALKPGWFPKASISPEAGIYFAFGTFVLLLLGTFTLVTDYSDPTR